MCVFLCISQCLSLVKKLFFFAFCVVAICQCIFMLNLIQFCILVTITCVLVEMLQWIFFLLCLPNFHMFVKYWPSIQSFTTENSTFFSVTKDYFVFFFGVSNCKKNNSNHGVNACIQCAQSVAKVSWLWMAPLILM